jgi:REP element-mobilizing transposase RayT
MARSIRIQIAGGFYHVMARGNRREKIFADDDDRRFFLQTLSEACAMTGWRIHAWVLMGNHYHLFIETPEANLVAGMQWLQNAYTRRFNVRHRKRGRLFGDRYKAVIVEGARGDYYRTLMDYIHLNPVRARIVEPRQGQSVLDYPWSSVAGGYALAAHRRAKWLAAAHGLSVFECGDDPAGRRRFVERVDRRGMEEETRRCGVPELPEEMDARCSHLRRGWYWGTQAFAEALMKRVRKPAAVPKGRAARGAPGKRSYDLAQAEKWLAEGLDAAGMRQSDLANLPGSDPRKVALASLLWKATTASQGWIARRLQMASAANVSQQVGRWKKTGKPALLPKSLRSFLQSVKN